MGQNTRWLVIAIALLSFMLDAVASDNIIEVFPNCNQGEEDWCFELDDVLNMTESISGAAVILYNGVHTVSSPQGSMLYNLVNMSFEGEESGAVLVTCTDDYGLAFFNATNLSITNVTFTNCGLSGSYLTNFINHLKKFVNVDFHIPEVLKVGIFIAQCENLTLENVVVANTSGIGMIGINILGHSKIVHSEFISNTRPNCSKIEAIPVRLFRGDPRLDYHIGGGLYLLYQDVNNSVKDLNSSLSIAHSQFIGNSECGYSAYTNLNYQYFSAVQKLRYMVGGGGGMSIYAVQTGYSLSMDVLETYFTENLAVYGSGVQIGLFVHSLFNNITFRKCNFIGNGGSYAKGGAGIAVFLNLYINTDSVNRRHHRECNTCKVISVLDSTFMSNKASGQGGGLLAYSLANHALTNYALEQYNNIMALKRCSFEANEAKYGSALYASQRATHGLDGIFGVVVEDVTMKDNSAEVGNVQTINGNYASAIDLRSVNMVVERGCLTVEESDSSAIYVLSSVILMQEGTTMNLRDNQATQGGGFLMEGYTPAIILAGNCTLNFSNNKASAKGGAILFIKTFDELDDLYPLNAGDCFLFGSDIYQETVSVQDILRTNNTIIFSNNDAPRGGIIYGSSLDSCPWTEHFTSGNVLLDLNTTETFVFSDLEIETKKVSSDPKILRINNGSKRIEAFPGRVGEVFLEVQDIFNKDIEAVIVADYFDADSLKDINFGDFIYKRANESSIRLTIPEVCNQNVKVTLYTESNLVGDSLNIEVKECPFGFTYNSSRPSGNCQCNYTNVPGVYCNNDDVTITVEGDTWLGCLTDNCTDLGELVVHHCKFGYCHTHNVTFNPKNTSNQCKSGSNRAGILCGECAEGYNITMGSFCGQCDISHLYVLALVTLDTFIVFFILSIVKVTIDKEWTNIIFFFCTIAFPYEFLSNPVVVPLKRALYLVRMVNRSRYLDVCFLYGLSALGRSGLTILYPISLLILILIFALVCRYSSFMSKHFSPAKTMMTIAYLLYVQTFEICFEILAPLPLRSIDGSVFDIRWALDPNVQYIRYLFHAILAIASISVFMIYLLPGFIFLLFPTKMYMHFKSFYPFLDIIWAPFKTKYRPWASIRLLFSVVIVIIAKYSLNFVISLPITICFIGLFLYVQTTLQPFKSRLANVLDNFFLVVVQIMHLIGFLLYIYEDFSSLYEDASSLKILVSVGISILAISYTIFFITFMWYWRESTKLLFGKLRNCYKYVPRIRKRKPTVIEAVERVPSRIPTHHILSLNGTLRLDYTRYRESILED